MAGLAYHNFVSAAVGIVLAIVVIRGIARRETDKLGKFWVDTTRCLLWILLPICLAGSLVPRFARFQNLKPTRRRCCSNLKTASDCRGRQNQHTANHVSQ